MILFRLLNKEMKKLINLGQNLVSKRVILTIKLMNQNLTQNKVCKMKLNKKKVISLVDFFHQYHPYRNHSGEMNKNLNLLNLNHSHQQINNILLKTIKSPRLKNKIILRKIKRIKVLKSNIQKEMS